METPNNTVSRKQERKLFVSIIVLLIVTYYYAVFSLQSEANDLRKELDSCKETPVHYVQTDSQ